MADALAHYLAHWPAFALALYTAIGLWHALHEVLACVRESRATGERAPLWPVWIVVTLAWPMLLAQRFVFWMIVLWDAASALRADRREVRREQR